MKKSRYFLLVIALVIGGSLFAQSQRELAQLMRNRGEYYFTLAVADRSEAQTINSLCSVDGFDGSNVVCYANQRQYDNLLQAGYQPNLQTPPSMLEEAVMWEGGDRATYEWDSYLTYEQYVSMMEGFPTSVTNGANCTLVDLGTLSTSNHRRILGVRLNNGQPDGKPKFLYTSTMHGDEVTGMILMLRLIDEFCTSSDSRILNILNNVDLFIFPNTNPDGTYYRGNSSVSNARRYNGNGIDLNRHFPDFDDGAHPDGASSYQDEAQWMMNLAQQYLFTMAANYHGGAEIMNYPWDTYQPLHPDDAWWQYVAREYAQSCQAVSSSYMTTANSSGDTPSGITNGYAWYTITGSRQDYMNYYGQCREITIECSKDKTPTASTLPNYWNYNHNAMLAYIEQCLNGIHGVVYAANSRETIEGATITVLNHDAFGSSVTSHAVGDFHRPIKGGTWTLEVAKEGYQSEQVTVTVTDGQRKDIEVYLTPTGGSGGGGDDPITPSATNCYEQVTPTAANDYVMGYLNGTTLTMPIHNNGTASTASVQVNLTDNGFSVENESAPGMVTLTSTGTTNQYYISYNGRYITRQSGGMGSSSRAITWSTSQSNYNKWTITANGITQTSTNRTYYLYFNNNGFYTSTSSNNNIKFYVETNCPVPQYTITASAAPEEGGSVTGACTYEEGATCILTATVNEGYRFVNWTEDDEVVATEATLSFTVTRSRALVANFSEIPPAEPNAAWIPNSDYPGEGMAVVAQIKIEGSLLDRATWEVGAFCNDECRACVYPLTDRTEDDLGYFAYMNIAGNDGDIITFRLYDAESGEDFPGYCRTTVELVNGGTLGMDPDARNLFVLNFVTTYTYTQELSEGWNWVSFYIATGDSVDLLDQLKESLGDNGLQIQASDGTVTEFDGEEWFGDLDEVGIYNEQAYWIETSAACTIELTGVPAVVDEYEITINPGWNWIGFPSAEPIAVADALANFEVEEGDQIQCNDATSTEFDGEEWFGDLETFTPGQGYMYFSASDETKILVFSTGAKAKGKTR